MSEGTVITFYSYKGGVGRTLALANVGALLCRWGYKVLCVDWDLEAPGLHLYFKPWMEAQDRPGLADLLDAQTRQQNPVWQDYITQVSFPNPTQSLSLMTAGRQDAAYVQKMQSLDWKRLYEEHNLGNYLEDLRSQWKESFDFILVDSRTGITDAGGICTVQLPDLMVLLFTANEQSLYGALDVVNRAKQARDSLPFDRAKLLVLPVAMRFEARVEYEMAQKWLAMFAEALAPLYAEWAQKDIAAADLLNHTRVPYIPYWSFGEKLPVIEKGTDDPEDIGYSLETLAALVAQRFSYSDLLLKNRDSFVAGVANRPADKNAQAQPASAEKPWIRIFISYSHNDKKYLDELESHLSILRRQGAIEYWHDQGISPGESQAMTANAYLEDANIILLLVSADWLASEFLYGNEMLRALERHKANQAVIIPVILRPCLWEASSLLSFFQTLPRGGMSVAAMLDRDEAWLQVINGIQAAAERLYKTQVRNRICIVFSHEDKEWLDLLRLYFKPLSREIEISVWDDTPFQSRIQDWGGDLIGGFMREMKQRETHAHTKNERIRHALALAKLVVLLVSPSFLASDFMMDEEIPLLLQAAKRDALKVVWVPISFSAYEETPINQFQAIHPPSEPLDTLAGPKQNKAFVEICKKIKNAFAGQMSQS